MLVLIFVQTVCKGYQIMEKIASTIGNIGFYECSRMAFGLINAPVTFTWLIEQ